MKETKHTAEDWHENAVIYNLFLRLFTPEGTLNAAEKQLPRLADLGVNVIYLSPVVLADDDMDRRFWSRRTRESGTDNPRNPYRAKDFFSIDLQDAYEMLGVITGETVEDDVIDRIFERFCTGK